MKLANKSVNRLILSTLIYERVQAYHIHEYDNLTIACTDYFSVKKTLKNKQFAQHLQGVSKPWPK